jgi:hypothetical protein
VKRSSTPSVARRLNDAFCLAVRSQYRIRHIPGENPRRSDWDWFPVKPTSDPVPWYSIQERSRNPVLLHTSGLLTYAAKIASSLSNGMYKDCTSRQSLILHP